MNKFEIVEGKTYIFTHATRGSFKAIVNFKTMEGVYTTVIHPISESCELSNRNQATLLYKNIIHVKEG